MAEARSIQFVGSELRRGVNLESVVDEQGLRLRLDLRIPGPRGMLRYLSYQLEHARRWLYYAVFPWGLGVLVLVAAAVVGVVASADPTSWWRNGWLAHLVWNVAMWFPWVPNLPHEAKVGVMAAMTAVVCFALLTAAQRFVLQLLLSWKGFLYAGRKPSMMVKAWFFAVKVLSGDFYLGGKPLLYSFQSALPKLPVPPLKDTVARYLRSVRPLLSDKEYAAAEAEADEFLTDPKQGPNLQWYLNLKALTSYNYVTDWWEDYVYLAGRSPLPVNSNFYVLDAASWAPTTNQCARAAMLTWSFLLYRSDLDNERIPPTRSNSVPLCMWQFERIFNTTRIPGLERDTIRHWKTTETKHIAVLSRGHWYSLAVCDSSARVMDPVSLQKAFQAIQKDSIERGEPEEHEASVAALTAWNRTRWAEARAAFFSEGRARRALSAVESAAFVVRLAGPEADLEATQWTERGLDLIIGDGCRCWFDKSFNITVFPNGKMGVNAEHAWADAPVIAHVMEIAMVVNESSLDAYDARTGAVRKDLIGEEIMERLEKNGISREAAAAAAGCVDGCGRPGAVSPRWTRLDWALTDGAKRAIGEAKVAAAELAEDLDLKVCEFVDFGKGFMKRCGVSPDGFVQMALQLAYYQDQGRFDATYESSMTRLFLHGRTETIRACSVESCAFVRAMLDDSETPTKKLALIRKACKHHVGTFRDSMAGRGVDRHLFALYVVSKGKDIDSPFLQSALGRPWRLSTSQQPQQQTDLWNPKDPKWDHVISPGGGFGPVTDDGYGVSYMTVKEGSIYFHISAKRSSGRTDATRFADTLFASLRKMKTILESAIAKE